MTQKIWWNITGGWDGVQKNKKKICLFIYRIREGHEIWECFARFGVRVKIAQLKFEMTNYFVANSAGGYYYDDDYHYYDDVLMFVTETTDWKKIGSMKTARSYHAASLVKIGDVIDYCN